MRYSLLLGALLSFSLTGCSVFMAASAPDVPDLDVLVAGTPKTLVDEQLGRPLQTLRTRSGTQAVYQYFTGDEANYRRAAAYALLDGVTLGFAELVTFPAEALQGDRHVVTVDFNQKLRVQRTSKELHSAPIDAPEKLLGLEETLRPNVVSGGADRASASAPAGRPVLVGNLTGTTTELAHSGNTTVDNKSKFLEMPVSKTRKSVTRY